MAGATERSIVRDAYRAFAAIDGRHPYRAAVPGGSVDYEARRRRDGEVVFFNYGLAREMGLIAASHPDRMTAGLRRAILDAFAIAIINEYDLAHGLSVPAGDRNRLPTFLYLWQPDPSLERLSGK